MKRLTIFLFLILSSALYLSLFSSSFLSIAHAQLSDPQCSNGIDDDSDGTTDALIELPTFNDQTLHIGGVGNPAQVRQIVRNAISTKGFPITLPIRDALVRSDGGHWVANGSDQGSNITEHLPTLQLVCRVMGYRDYVSSTCRDAERSSGYPHGKCNFHSPGDNLHWRAVNGNLQAESADPKYSSTWIASITCKHKLPACSDGWDNDGDGRIDLEDPGCASANDNSEIPHDANCSSPNDPFERDPECNDGIDNDGDAVVDLSDPGCAGNPLNDDESAATTQCQDNIDNDGDGAKDLEDYSCLGDNTKNDEANPPSECQDGVDNDGDLLTDQDDPACTTPQHNNEGSSTTQCQDGIDNDGDGASDMNDYSCQGLPTNDNEALPLAECQDTVDNDGDGLTDLADPGCPNSQDNFEGDGTSQCQDGIDNDGDGATDRDDFSCQGDNTKNDESSPLAQCQDSIDNDSDGVTDMDDPGCSSPQDNNEGDGTTACQDGIDNDRDGAVDLADYSCEGNPLNRYEANPKSQCQNGSDDDSDGLTDMNDPGCSSPQDNDESDGTSQCQNGSDDDNDGLTDMADPGCASPQDNDESDGTSQCQNGSDDDNDGLTDIADPGCATPQDNDESDGTSQCQNGSDDDNDGLTDMADPGCSNPQDNNESDGTSQCQNGSDDDNDGLTDIADPGCAAPQDNDESDGTSQCQNSSDDDNDGLTDMADPGCATPQDNDESDGTSQCQNRTDDDNDGLTDMVDPGCATPQDNDESDGTSQCQNGRDDDNDGLTDSADPGCTNPQDNDESDEPTLLSLGVECITKNTDDTKTAYFSYNNIAGADVTVVSDATSGTINEFLSDDATIDAPPNLFKSGLTKGGVAVTFGSPSLTWVVRPSGSAQVQATANESTPECSAVVPFSECRGFKSGVMTVRLGYDNPNEFPQQFDIGTNNGFTPDATDRGQPTQFFSGLNNSVFEVGIEDIDAGVEWNINGQTIRLDSTIPDCAGQCTEVSSAGITEELDAIAEELSQLVVQAADILQSSEVRRRRDRKDATRAKRKAANYEAAVKELTIQIPDVTKTCPEAPQLCVTVDRGPVIESLKGLYAVQKNSVRRIITRAYWRNTGRTRRNDKLVRQAVALEKDGLAALADLPRFAEDCK